MFQAYAYGEFWYAVSVEIFYSAAIGVMVVTGEGMAMWDGVMTVDRADGAVMWTDEVHAGCSSSKRIVYSGMQTV